MAYEPADTPLLQLAYTVSAELAAKPRPPPLAGEPEPPVPSWATVSGIAILLEQGYHQFELWTGRKAPRATVQKEVWKQYKRNS